MIGLRNDVNTKKLTAIKNLDIVIKIVEKHHWFKGLKISNPKQILQRCKVVQ